MIFRGDFLKDLIKAFGVKLSETRKNRDTKKWTSHNAVVKEEPGDSYYGKEEIRKKDLAEDFKAYGEKLKDFARNIKSQMTRSFIFNRHGKRIARGDKPDFSQENIIVTKSAGFPVDTKPEVFKTLEALGEKLSAAAEKEIKPSELQGEQLLAIPEKEIKSSEAPGEKLSSTPKEEIANSMDLKQGEVQFEGKKATIGTFNIEWLGTKERTEEDYKEIAQVIKDSNAQLLGIQEVTSEESMDRVMKYLPDYGYILGKADRQKVAVLFDKNRVKYDINSIDQLDSLQGGTYLRSPLLVDVKLDDGFDFSFVVVHLKANFDEEAVEKRTEQASLLNKWIKKHLKKSEDKDVIVVGDFNDFLESDSLKVFKRSRTVEFVTEEAPEDFYSTIPYNSFLDHALLTSGEKGSMKEYIPGSIHSIDENKYPEYKDRVSNHRPVLFDVRTDIDDD